MLWMIAAWTFVSPQNFNLVSLVPNASGILLSLNNSFVQLGTSAGAGMGGVAVGGMSVMAITWFGAASAVFAAFVAAVSFTSVTYVKRTGAFSLALKLIL
ncbi:hypothetical protein FB550_1013 [Neobacillus bataviensis]|uniref:Uncharacterized protein n=1 Tax=Neobacillus bataviensis TaxID=220685 RepID=A0A561DXE9_9BACI|nr:hypothetical protein [Neobacillus bataviensis]TWE07992.1 hypothetical protein FB550_1013 [Neobacillus bataviensis]